MTKIDKIVEELRKLYPQRPHDYFQDPLRTLLGCILSQRTRDENTWLATNQLFTAFPTLNDIANADVKDIETVIRPAGFYKVKAKRIKEVAQIIRDKYNGEVPKSEEELLTLPGVGRKTANIVLVFAYGIDAIPVDTHVHRISNRLGLVHTKTPEETEKELRKVVPKKYWLDLNRLMVAHGQHICKPLHPLCNKCPLRKYCDYYTHILGQEKKT